MHDSDANIKITENVDSEFSTKSCNLKLFRSIMYDC